MPPESRAQKIEFLLSEKSKCDKEKIRPEKSIPEDALDQRLGDIAL